MRKLHQDGATLSRVAIFPLHAAILSCKSQLSGKRVQDDTVCPYVISLSFGSHFVLKKGPTIFNFPISSLDLPSYFFYLYMLYHLGKYWSTYIGDPHVGFVEKNGLSHKCKSMEAI